MCRGVFVPARVAVRVSAPIFETIGMRMAVGPHWMYE